MTGPHDIAIVGMSGLFPAAPDIDVFWSNILDKVDAVTDSPDDWLGNGDIYDPESDHISRIYTRRGGFLGDLARFDPREFGTMPLSIVGAQPDQFLALKLAREALIDAGLTPGAFDGERTGVILGLAVHANRANTNGVQQFWFGPQVRELFRAALPEVPDARLDEAMDFLSGRMPRITPDAMPGLVPNILTGRIANRLNLMGPNYIIDAACASSLITVDLAINELRSGNADVMLAGGVNTTTSPLVYAVFCAVDALSRQGLIRPFGRESSGTVLGEGAGIVVLKRLEDALAADDRIYAVIKGSGQSSDGTSTGLMAPRREGAELAVRRAYESSGIDPATIGLVEAHGTGIPLGERVEIEALRNVFGGRQGRLPTVPIGSVKSMIGHCIPAAGSAAIIKTALALKHRVVPPTLVGEVASENGMPDTPFYVAEEARPWVQPPSAPRRAAINAFGFGGINAHLVLEESPAGRSADPTAAFFRPPAPVQAPGEQVFAFAGPDAAAIAAALEGFALPAAEDFATRAAACWDAAKADGPARLAVVAATPAELEKKLATARKQLESRGGGSIQTRNGIYFEPVPVEGRVAFLFPGEMAQYTDMLKEAAMSVPAIGDWLADLSALTQPVREVPLGAVVYPPDNMVTDETRGDLETLMHQVDYGSEMVFAADQAIHDTLRALGLRPDAMLGHSTGENAALVASGRLDLDRAGICRLIAEMNGVFDKVAESEQVPNGVLLTVAAMDRERLEEILAEFGQVHFTMDNCPNQAVVFGDKPQIDALQARVVAENAVCTRLPISWGYHTEYVRPMAEGFRALFDGIRPVSSEVTLYSCATAKPFPEDPDAAMDTAVAQYVSRVRFREAILQLYEDGHRIFVECGPNANLTAFVRDTLGDRPHLAESADNRRRGLLSQLRHLVARLYTAGLELTAEEFLFPAPSADATRRRAAREVHLAQPYLPSELASYRLDPEAAAAFRERLLPGDAAAAGDAAAPQPETPPPHASAPAAGLAAAPRAPADGGAAPAGRRPQAAAQVMHGHISLMDEFLKGQETVMDRAIGTPGAAPPARPRIGVVDLTRGFDLPFGIRAYAMQGTPSAEAMLPYLGEAERAEFAQLCASARQSRWREWGLSRLAVKRAAAEILSAETGRRPADHAIEIRKAESGAPYLAAAGIEGLPRISIAHSAASGVGAASAGGRAIGIDFDLPERIRDAGGFLETILGPQETAELRPGADRVTAAMLWAAKEAAAKALGVGLQGRPEAFRIRGLDRQHGRALIEHEGRQVTAHLRRVGRGVCAIAYPGG